MEIPCPTCRTWSDFIQDKLEISSTCPETSINKVNSILYFELDQLFFIKLACCLENSVDPDQLASSKAS